LSHIQGGQLSWYCQHCKQIVPYSVDPKDLATQSNHRQQESSLSVSPLNHPLEETTTTRQNSFETNYSHPPLFSSSITHTFTLREFLQTAVTGIKEFLQVDRVLVAKMGESGDITVMEEARQRPWKTMLHMRIGQFVSLQEINSWQQGKIYAIADVYQEDNVTALDRLFDVKAKIIVPIAQQGTNLTQFHPNGKNSASPYPKQSGKLWGILIAHQCSGPRQWTSSEIGVLSLLGTQVALSIQQDSLYQHLNTINEKLERLAFLDNLTQIPNRHYFEQYFDQEWRRMAREQQPLSIILGDVDFFKAYNDVYGHPAGDHCLQQVAYAIKSVLHRPGDLVSRYGGEEFIIVLPNTKASGAVHVAEQIRTQVKQLNMASGCHEVNEVVTLSLGVASTIPNGRFSPTMLVAAADQALYHAKEKGRDRVILYHQSEPPQPSTPSTIVEHLPLTPYLIDQISNIELLMSYVAYFVSRGVKISSPRDGVLPFEGFVYQYQGYHQEFLNFWRKFEHRNDYQELSLEGDAHSFGEFLEGDCTVNECARCHLPIVIPTGHLYNLPNCTLCLKDYGMCRQQELGHCPHHVETLRVLVISPPTENVRTLQQWLAANEVEAVFISDPKEVNDYLLLEPITTIIIDADISEKVAKSWAKQLREYSKLEQVPIIALSDKAGQGTPWVERKLGLEDYVLTPLTGETLVKNLQEISKTHASINVPEIYWFPR
jgi:diguanylate cyclase (GGDEF)-like protein